MDATILADPAFAALRDRLASGPPCAAVGLWGSSAPIFTALISREVKRPLLYITPHLEQADSARDDIETTVAGSAELFPAWETLPGEGAGAGEIAEERTRVCLSLSSKGDGPHIPFLVAPIQALLQPVPTLAG